MHVTSRLLVFLLLSSITFSTHASLSASPQYHLQSIAIGDRTYTVNLPVNYKLELLTGALNGPRLLTFLPDNELLIGSKSGNIYRLKPPYSKAEILLTLDDYPHSMAYRNKELFIAKTTGLFKIPYIPGQKSLLQSDLKLVAALPAGGHSSRTVKLGPDKNIYLSLGISGNCSDEYLDDSYAFEYRRGGIYKLTELNNKTALEVYASGLRNPVGFDWHPESHIMYASNNGPDHQGFNTPPEYFSKITQNSFHGMPWYQFNGQTIKADDCIHSKAPHPVSVVSEPVVTFPARNAPMDVAFVPINAMDSSFVHDAVVALHGSWATPSAASYSDKKSLRRQPKLVIVKFINSEAKNVIDLATGFQLANGDRWARPVGIAFGPDNNLYFTSDSGAHGLFRISRILNNK